MPLKKTDLQISTKLLEDIIRSTVGIKNLFAKLNITEEMQAKAIKSAATNLHNSIKSHENFPSASAKECREMFERVKNDVRTTLASNFIPFPFCDSSDSQHECKERLSAFTRTAVAMIDAGKRINHDAIILPQYERFTFDKLKSLMEGMSVSIEEQAGAGRSAFWERFNQEFKFRLQQIYYLVCLLVCYVNTICVS